MRPQYVIVVVNAVLNCDIHGKKDIIAIDFNTVLRYANASLLSAAMGSLFYFNNGLTGMVSIPQSWCIPDADNLMIYSSIRMPDLQISITVQAAELKQQGRFSPFRSLSQATAMRCCRISLLPVARSHRSHSQRPRTVQACQRSIRPLPVRASRKSEGSFGSGHIAAGRRTTLGRSPGRRAARSASSLGIMIK